MKVAFYMNCVSAHQLPLAKEVAELVGAEYFRYIDAGEKSESAQTVDVSRFQGFKVERLKGFKVSGFQGFKGEELRKDEGRGWIETADVMLTGMRDLELFERRAKKGLRTYYTSERWFKPVVLFDLRLFDCLISVTVPGWVRMVVPGYRRMVKRFVTWANEDEGARVLAIGPWAKKDFLKMGVRAEKIVDWGYYVAKGRGMREAGRGADKSNNLKSNNQTILKVFWCGRMLGLKRVDTIIRAVRKIKVERLKGFKVEKFQGRRVSGVKVTLVGDGPEKGRLQRMALSCTSGRDSAFPLEIEVVPSQPMEKVRELMREHDLFVFPSNGYEGWGAVVSEALEEGMRVLGTFEAGASATLLPRERLFRSGDWKGLAQLIEKEMRGELPPCSIGEWTAKAAAKRLMGL